MKKVFLMLFFGFIVMTSTACEKKEVIGYVPEIPQQWIDAQKEEEQNPMTEMTVTLEFDGIWQRNETGLYYHLYNGQIYTMKDRNASKESDFLFWGDTVATIEVPKEDVKNNNVETDFEQDMEITQHYFGGKEGSGRATTTIIDDTHTKTVTEDGRVFTFTFVEEVDGPPAGIEY